MADRSARFGTSQSGTTGVRKQIEHLHRPVRSADLPSHKVPVYRLLRKQSRMFKSGRANLKGQPPVSDFPFFLNQGSILPAAAARIGADISGIRLFPGRVRFGSIPDNLRVRSDQQHISPPFQLFPFGSIDDFIVFPLVGNSHNQPPNSAWLQSRP